MGAKTIPVMLSKTGFWYLFRVVFKISTTPPFSLGSLPPGDDSYVLKSVHMEVGDLGQVRSIALVG